jgi:biotin carboxylase
MLNKLAVIGASYLQRPLVEKAKAMGVYTICFAWAEGAVCKDLADEFYPISIVDKDEILKVCQGKQIDGICTIASDVAAPTVAYVAEQMGLVSNSYQSAVTSNNKYAMREAFIKAGVLCPLFKCVDNSNCETIEEIKQNILLPLVVKPADRSGSLGVAKITEWEELKSAIDFALNCSFKKQVMVEEFIEGREISVEFISYKGTHYPLQITDKVTTGAPHFVELEHHQPSTLSEVKFDEIYKITEKALNALGITNGASHSEYKITEEGKVYVIEIGGRMGGDFIGSDLVQLSTGYDFVKGVIEVALGYFTEPKITDSKYSGVYFLCKETEYLLPILQKADTISEIVSYEQTDNELRNITCSSDRSGYMIYQGDKKLLL